METHSSNCYKAFDDEDQWRERYWEVYKNIYGRKLLDWKHEEEMRIKIANTFGQFNTRQSRIVKYDSKILRGVVFGIRTSEYDRLRIFNALKKRKRSLTGIKFKQAWYDSEAQTIKIRDIAKSSKLFIW